MQASLKQTVVVDNKPGANGLIGNDAVARASKVSNGALNHQPGRHGEAAEPTLRTTRSELVALSAGRGALAAALAQGRLRLQGQVGLMQQRVEALDEFEPMFNIVEP